MSVTVPTLTPALARSGRGLGSAAFWVGAAAFMALVLAAASMISWKLGFAVVIAFAAAGAMLVRPYVLLPIAAVTVLLEGVTFGGTAVTRLLAPGAALVIAAEFLRGGARIRFSAPLVWAGLYVIWATASGLWTEAPDGTRFMLQSLGIALVFMFAFAALLNTETELKILLYVVVFGAAILGALSVLAFRSGFEIPYLTLAQSGRSQGGVGDPDFFAGMQLVFTPLALALASETRQKWLRVAVYVAVLILLASVFTSLSRGGFLALILLMTLFIASRPERLFRFRKEKAAALVVLALGMVAFFSRPYAREQIVTRAESIYAPKTQEEASGAGRTELWKGALRTARENPIFGVGAGSFIYISQDLILNTPGVNPLVFQKRNEGENFVAHNTYLGSAAELGFTGLALYVGLILATALSLWRTAMRAPMLGAPFVGRVAYALLLGLAAWSVVIFFLSGEAARTFWIIVGLSIALPKLIPQPEVGAPAAAAYRARSNAPMS
jgi:O-antigen ligase